MNTFPQFPKAYRCARCGYVTKQTTNHHTTTWSLDRCGVCPECPPWAKYTEFGGQTVWTCMEPEPTRLDVKGGGVEWVVTIQNKERYSDGSATGFVNHRFSYRPLPFEPTECVSYLLKWDGSKSEEIFCVDRVALIACLQRKLDEAKEEPDLRLAPALYYAIQELQTEIPCNKPS